jgi:hypothetical protein
MLRPSGFIGLRIFPLIAICLGAEATQGQVAAETLAAYEKEMAQHPQEALAIARRAVKMFVKEEKRLYALAVQLQEKNLPFLGLGQVTELAETMEKKLEDRAASNRIRVSWLQQRGLGLNTQEVRQLLGSPAHVSSQILYRRQIEQWSYDLPASLSLIFLCTKGQIPHLQTVHSPKH